MSDNRVVNKEAIESRKARKEQAKQESLKGFLSKDFFKVFQDKKGFDVLNKR